MQALTFQDVGQVLLTEVADPRLEQERDVLVGVQLAGICGSDLHVYCGREGGLDRGTVMGHEFVGEVVEVGTAVDTLRPGDLVSGPFTTSCGKCFYCRRALTGRCRHGQLLGWRQQGVGLHGTQAELLRVPLADTTLVRVPEGISRAQALLAGDVLATGYFCARQAEVGPHTTVAVLGCGPVGLMAVLAAAHLGARWILAIDSIPERLELAERFGARVVNYRQSSPQEEVATLTRGLGVDAVLEAVGSPEATRLAIDLLRPGGTVSAVGVHTEERFAFSPLEAYDKNLTYRIGRCPARHYLDIVLPILEALPADPASIVSHRLPLTSGAYGYRIFNEKLDGCTKVVLEP